jgi:hypothetical protein
MQRDGNSGIVEALPPASISQSVEGNDELLSQLLEDETAVTKPCKALCK